MATSGADLTPQKGTVSSVIWNWFGFVASDKEQTSPRCKVCLKAVATKGSSTTHLLQHLKQRHATECHVFFYVACLYHFNPRRENANKIKFKLILNNFFVICKLILGRGEKIVLNRESGFFVKKSEIFYLGHIAQH